MAYSKNPHLPRVRMQAVLLVRQGWSIRRTARHLGFHHTAVMRWLGKASMITDHRHTVPTESSRPHSHPNSLKQDIVDAIIKQRKKNNRCAEVVHQELLNQGIATSLSSVKRTLDRNGLLKKRSPWKRPHDNTPRPIALYSGALLQCDTIHIIAPDGSRIYVYTLIDLFSRWAYAEVVEKIGAEVSVQFVKKAQKEASFRFEMIQTDNGPEFSTWCTNGWKRLGIAHRHGRVRKSNDQAHVERFNRTVQEECLDRVAHNVSSFKKALETYLPYYNNERTHMGINYLTPLQVLQRS